MCAKRRSVALLVLSMAWGSSGIDGGLPRTRLVRRLAPRAALTAMASSRPRDSLDLPRKLLLQCAIQTQLSYAVEFKNELMGRWVCSFLGHEHLRVHRTGDYGSGRVTYRGLDGLRCSWRDYFLTMLSSGLQEYEVRYRVGTADIGHWPKGDTDEAGVVKTASGEPAPWAEAAASRRANPYLQQAEPQYKLYTEVVEPRRVARGLMAIREQLAAEFSDDLRTVAADCEWLRGWYCEQQASADAPDVCVAEARAPAVVADDDRLARSAPGAVEVLDVMFASAKSAWSDASTPFRSLNYDLLQRALVREAGVRAAGALGERGEGATCDWLRAEIDAWMPRFESPVRRHEGGHFLLALLSAQPRMRTNVDGSVSLIDPAAAFEELAAARAQLAEEWAMGVEGTGDEHAELLRADLTKQLSAEMTTGDSDQSEPSA